MALCLLSLYILSFLCHLFLLLCPSASLWNFSLVTLGEIWLENMKVLSRFWFTEFDGWSLNERFRALKEAQNPSISNCPNEANLWFSSSIWFTNQPLILDLNLQDKHNCRPLFVDCCRIRINLGLWISKDLVDHNDFPNSCFWDWHFSCDVI